MCPTKVSHERERERQRDRERQRALQNTKREKGRKEGRKEKEGPVSKKKTSQFETLKYQTLNIKFEKIYFGLKMPPFVYKFKKRAFAL